MSILLVIPVLIFALSWWRPTYGVFAVVVLWPAYLLHLTITGIPTTILELSLYALGLAVLLSLLAHRLDRRWPRFPKTLLVLLAVWAIAWAVATIGASDHRAALGALKAWLVDAYIFGGLLALLIRSERERRQLLQVALISGVIVAVAGFYEYVFRHASLQDGRLSSFFHPVPNYAAMYLAPLIVIGLAALLMKYIRPRWWIAVGVIIVALAMTFSYGGYMSLGAGSIIIWLTLPKGGLKTKLLIGGVVAAGLIVIMLSTTKNFAEHFTNADRTSGLVRQQIWVTSWALIQQRPVLGLGPNNFEAAYRRELPKHYFPPLEWLVAQPHNLALALWLETGLLGLLTFAALCCCYVRTVWRNFLPRPDQRAAAVASMAALTAILIHGLVDTPYFKNDLAPLFIFVMVFPWLGQTTLQSTARHDE